MLKQIREGLGKGQMDPELEAALKKVAGMGDMQGLLKEQGKRIAELFTSKAGGDEVVAATNMVQVMNASSASRLVLIPPAHGRRRPRRRSSTRSSRGSSTPSSARSTSTLRTRSRHGSATWRP
jgi:hypothetical protein